MIYNILLLVFSYFNRSGLNNTSPKNMVSLDHIKDIRSSAPKFTQKLAALTQVALIKENIVKHVIKNKMIANTQWYGQT